MSLKEARNALAARLAPELETKFKIFPGPKDLGRITQPTLLLVRTDVGKLPEAPLGFLMNSCTLYVIDNITDDEDRLDDLLEEVLEALDSSNTRWLKASRDRWGETNPCYRVTLEIIGKRKDPA